MAHSFCSVAFETLNSGTFTCKVYLRHTWTKVRKFPQVGDIIEAIDGRAQEYR